jgi:uncharacterized membrane protein
MTNLIISTFLFSISPFGEARFGILYGILNGLNPFAAFLIGMVANLLIFPLVMFLLGAFNARLWKCKLYRKGALKLMRRAKNGVGKEIQKYGFWGLMIFVMIPLPVTGAYMASLAAYIFKIQRKQAFVAISLGVIISCLIMATGVHYGILGISML